MAMKVVFLPISNFASSTIVVFVKNQFSLPV